MTSAVVSLQAAAAWAASAQAVTLELPVDCEIVIYRQTCDHCKEHLEELAMEPPMLPLVLLRVAEIGDTPENEVTQVKPADHIPMELPAIPRGYGIETPMTVTVEGWVVTKIVSHR